MFTPWTLDEYPAAARVAMTQVGEYTVHSVEYGQEGEWVVLVHGLSGSSRWWTRNAPDLADGFRVVVPDLIGFGRSARPRVGLPGIPEAARVLSDWMADRGIVRAHVIGHSMGGQVAMHLAAEHPDRVERLVLVDAAGIPRDVGARALARFAAEVTPLWRWGDPRFLPVIASDALIAGPRTLAKAIRHIVKDDVRPLLGRIRAPTLIVWGERDGLVPVDHARTLREGIPNARLAVLRAASHNPMVDRPADFNRIVTRFLEGEEVGR